MAASRSGPLPACRLTGDDLARVASVFADLAAGSEGPDNPIFRFETPNATYSYDTFALQSRRVSQRDVAAVEMIARNDTGDRARLFMDLEEGPLGLQVAGVQAPTSRSRLEVDGDESVVHQFWDEIVGIVQPRRSRLAAAAQHPALALPVLLLLVLTVIFLPAITATRMGMKSTNPAANSIFIVGLVLGLALLITTVTFRAPDKMWPKIAVEGWGRYERRRRTIGTWMFAIGTGLVVWLISLGLSVLVPALSGR